MAGSVPTELGVKPINQLIRQYAVPGIIAMTASSLYNMVDSIYIGHIADVGSLAISGLAVTFPLMNISTAFGTLVGVGAATMISVLLGQKNYAVANKVLSNEVTLNIITGLVFTFVTLMWMDPILRFFGATEATLPFARQYMTVIAIGNAVTHLYFGLHEMHAGEKASFCFGYNLGYGSSGSGSMIPGYAALQFDIELVPEP